VFQQNPADFYPYSSKYDDWLRGKPHSAARNCAACNCSTPLTRATARPAI
jgi:cytochrome c peroxidase